MSRYQEIVCDWQKLVCTDKIHRQFWDRESTVQAQPASEELRCDGADHAVPKLDMSGMSNGGRRCAAEMDACTFGA